MPDPLHDSTSLSGHPRLVPKVLVVIGTVLVSAVVVALLWQGAEIALLIFAGLLLAIFLRGLSDVVSTYTTLPSHWALLVVLLSPRLPPHPRPADNDVVAFDPC